MTLLDYTITGRTSSSHCGPLIKTERGDRQLQSGHWLRYSTEVILIFEGNGSVCLPHVRTGTLPQEKALPVVVVQFSFTKFSVTIVWTFWLNRLPFKIIFVKLIVLMTLTVPKV